jgi:hypothetical protein
MSRLSSGIACFVVLGLAVAASATAAQRYAAPEGKGPEPCAQATPCSLENAVTKASSNDEVILDAGHYTLSETLFGEAEGLSIHGDFSGPMPTISATLPYQMFEVYGAGSVVSYIEFIDKGEEGYPLFCIGTRVERVRAIGIGKKARGLVQSEGCVVRDSVILASGEGATALESVGLSSTTGVTRNVTAIAEGPESVGVSSLNTDPFMSGVHALDLRNSIAQGGKVDLLAENGFEGASEIFAAHSNFNAMANEGDGKVSDGGGNQTASPLFVDAANGDYREAAGSPTIDAGVADQLGALDLGGNPRVQGAAVDIGAYEFSPPPSVPMPVVGQLQSLTINPRAFRAVNAGGAIVSRKSRRRAPIGATVAYTMSAGGTVIFTAERRLSGRRVGKACKPVTRANRHHKKCTRSKPAKGSFAMESSAGSHSFSFSGRLESKALKPGRYRLLGSAGGVTKSAPFRIVK